MVGVTNTAQQSETDHHSYNNNNNNNNKDKNNNSNNNNNNNNNSNNNNNNKVRSILLGEGLFMWELIASFSPPRTVCILETIHKQIRNILLISSTGTRLMQKYWNAQYHKLIWVEDEEVNNNNNNNNKRIQRATLDFTLTRSEGKKNWKQMFINEYPQYIARTIQGVGAINNNLNSAKVLFKIQQINEKLTADELRKLELTPKEALAKRVAKNLISLEGKEAEGEVKEFLANNNNKNNININNSLQQQEEGEEGVTHHNHHHNNNNNNNKLEKKNKNKSKSEKRRQVLHNLDIGVTREDYHENKRLGERRGKHKKGGGKRWSEFGGGEED